MVTRNQIIGAVSTVCQLPSFILTVIPTAAYDPGLAVCMAITVVMLPLVPFALRNAHDTGWKMLLVVLGVGLLLFNFTNALDTLNGSHAAATNPVRAKMVAAAALDEKISELDVRKRLVEPHKIVSRESAQALATARDDECKVVGPKCKAKNEALLIAQRDRKLTERAEDIERDLDHAKADRAALGAVEKTDDRTSAQLASVIGLPSEVISTNRPVFRAFVVETLGGLGPFVLALVFGAPAVAAAKAKPKVRKNTDPPSKDSVHQWHGKRLVEREGRSVRAGVAHADYQVWCYDNGLASVNLRLFGEVMRDELGVQKKGSGTRTSYAGVELRSPKLELVKPLQNPCRTSAKPLGRQGKRGKVATAATA